MKIADQPRRILLLESDPPMRERLEALLLEAGYRVLACSRLDQLLERLEQRPYDLILTSFDGDSSASSIRVIRRAAPTTPLVVLSDPDAIRGTVRAIREGADDYLMRPPDPFELKIRLNRILERHDLDSRVTFFQDEVAKRSGSRSLEVRSPAMQSVMERLRRVAPMRSTVLVYGESGVGKELVARAIHFDSPRRNRPFIALNCAAIPASLIESELFGHERGSFTGAHARMRGKFEMAHRGTLFLDEIGEMAPATQVKLLRFLEQREFMRVGGDQSIRVDVRVIAATNADLENLVTRTTFRRDLYYRLKVVTITVPPLRERREDIQPLVETFLDQLSRANAVAAKSLAPDALAALVEYAWPGNVRELKNLVESLLVSVTKDQIDASDLPSAIARHRAPAATSELQAGQTLAEVERELIRRTLEHTGGNRTHSAAMLGIGVRTLQRKIRTYGLQIRPRRRRARRPATTT